MTNVSLCISTFPSVVQAVMVISKGDERDAMIVRFGMTQRGTTTPEYR
jgi:hypothetical protein